MTKRDLETAIDLTYLCLSDPCLIENEFVLSSRQELTEQHFILLKALAQMERDEEFDAKRLNFGWHL